MLCPLKSVKYSKNYLNWVKFEFELRDLSKRGLSLMEFCVISNLTLVNSVLNFYETLKLWVKSILDNSSSLHFELLIISLHLFTQISSFNAFNL